ncbi:hypothetical protein POM88_040728 [Heracleum sosnowskyi]|uniref:Cytochrome P450 n=1 Tax=Heracleum sosnowskyi TaxID=360622 RepID=A0AAD8HCU0_9APIA|nr:hypothetical protein POM88_040728 [Heracleum sosnowskyi]
MRALISRLYESSGKKVLLRHQLLQTTLCSISRIALGKKFFSAGESEDGIVTVKAFCEMLEEYDSITGVINLGDWIPWINFLDLQGYVKRMKALSKKFDRIYDHVLDEHRDRRDLEKDKFVAHDFVDFLLQLSDDQESSLEVKLNPDQIKGLTQDLLTGGTDTSALTIEWAMRMCPGYVLGLKVVTSIIGNLLHGFNWRLPDNTKNEELSMDEVYGLGTTRKYPLVAVTEPRLPLHLY